MTYFEKLRAMDVDELAEFIENCGCSDGFVDMACRECRYQGQDDFSCLATDRRAGCIAALKSRLEQEVKE